MSVSPVLIGEEVIASTGFKKFLVATLAASEHNCLKRHPVKSLLRPEFVIAVPSSSRAISLFKIAGDAALIGAAKIWFCKKAAVIMCTTSELMCIFSEERERKERYMYYSDEPISQFHNIPYKQRS